MNAVCPVSRQIRRTSSCSVPRVSASSAENGSSISIIFCVIESARAMPTRCFMPPESFDGALCLGPGEDVQPRGLAAAGVPDHAAELAARHRQPEILEHRDLAAVGAGIAFCDALDGNELIGHAQYPCPARGAARS